MKNAFFMTGTDTDAGKTTIAAALLYAARKQGLTTLGCKPVASGCHHGAEGLRNDDALALAAQSSIQLPYAQLNPFAFAPAIAPHAAAQQAGVHLDVASLQAACSQVLSHRADVTLIEGAGGWRVPISQLETLADLAKALQLPVILVVAVRLGCINHALLTAEAIINDGVELAGWVANCVDPLMPARAQTISCLQQWLPAPCLAQVSWQADANLAALAQQLNPALESLL